MHVLAEFPPVFEGAVAITGLMASWITLRGALAGFVALIRGANPRKVGDEAGNAAAAAIPTAALLAIASALYLALDGQ